MAENRFHWDLSGDSLHGIVRWTVATYAEIGDIAALPGEIGKVVLVEEDHSLHAVVSVTGEGVTWARLDNEPAIYVSDSPPIVISAQTEESAGTAPDAARADHAHALGSLIRWEVSSLGDIGPDAGDEGKIARLEADGNVSLYLLARSEPDNHLWLRIDNELVSPGVSVSSSAPTTLTATTAAAAGSSPDAARADHAHAITTAAPVAVGSGNAIGTSSALARADHVHDASAKADTAWVTTQIATRPALGTGTPTALDAATAGTAGASNAAAPFDHRHAITTAAPVAVGSANAPGTSGALARADHVHDASSKADVGWVTTQINSRATIGTGTPSAIDPNASASSGVANTAAPFDHRHSVATAAPVAVGSANALGSSSALARADHVHDASGLRLPIITWVGWTNGTSGWADIADPAPLGDVALVDGWLSVSVKGSPVEAAQWKQLAYQSDLESDLLNKAPLLVPTRTITAATATLALYDVGGSLLCDSATQQTITLPSMASVAIPVGAMILIVQLGVGSVVIAAGGGVTLRSSVQGTLQTRAQYAPPVSVWKIAADTWLVSGGLY